MSVLILGTANVTMLASNWPMKAPMHTVATTSQGALGRRRTHSGRAGSRNSLTQPRAEYAVEAASPGEFCSVTELF